MTHQIICKVVSQIIKFFLHRLMTESSFAISNSTMKNPNLFKYRNNKEMAVFDINLTHIEILPILHLTSSAERCCSHTNGN